MAATGWSGSPPSTSSCGRRIWSWWRCSGAHKKNPLAAASEGVFRSDASDVVGGQRLEAVEGHRRVGGGVGAGGANAHPVANGEVERQLVLFLLVHDVGAVAGRAGKHHGFTLGGQRAVEGQRVLDRLVHGLGQAAEL